VKEKLRTVMEFVEVRIVMIVVVTVEEQVLLLIKVNVTVMGILMIVKWFVVVPQKWMFVTGVMAPELTGLMESVIVKENTLMNVENAMDPEFHQAIPIVMEQNYLLLNQMIQNNQLVKN